VQNVFYRLGSLYLHLKNKIRSVPLFIIKHPTGWLTTFYLSTILLANVNSRSRSLSAIARPSVVVCRL